MSIKVIRKFQRAGQEKPYSKLVLEPETLVELDKLYTKIIASKDVMNLRLPDGSHSNVDAGIVVLADGKFTLFFNLKDSKSDFFYSIAGQGFGLRKPEPGQYWSYSSGIWLHLDNCEARRVQLWQSFSSRYLENPDPPPPPKRRQKSETDESSATSVQAVSKNSPKPLTPEILRQLGFDDGPTC